MKRPLVGLLCVALLVITAQRLPAPIREEPTPRPQPAATARPKPKVTATPKPRPAPASFAGTWNGLITGSYNTAAQWTVVVTPDEKRIAVTSRSGDNAATTTYPCVRNGNVLVFSANQDDVVTNGSLQFQGSSNTVLFNEKITVTVLFVTETGTYSGSLARR